MMITSDDIRKIDFSTSMSGYKKAEVDDFLDEVAEDFDKIIAQNRELNEKISNLPDSSVVVKNPSSSEDTTESLRGILESAQRFSEQLVSEAKQKAEEIVTAATLKAKQIEEKITLDKANHDELLASLKAQAEAEVAEKLKSAAEKSEKLILAAKENVTRQQIVFDKLRVEADNFKNKLLDSYKKQLELMNEFPPAVPFEKKKTVENIKDAVKSENEETLVAEQPEKEEAQPILEHEESNLEDKTFFEGLKR